MANSYEYLPVPSHSGEYGHYSSPELLYSYAKFTQHGATLAGGQGELPLGTILCRGTGANAAKYVKYTGAGTPSVALGFLRRGADSGAAGAPDQLVNLVDSGIVKLEIVEAAYGGKAAAAAVIAAAVDELNGRVDDANSFISF
jgi:hypothetical protein